jgi:mannose-6-phosphate isomerase-like protein (cupin superfamily)
MKIVYLYFMLMFAITIVASARETDLKMFIGNWKDSQRGTLYGSVVTRPILTKCEGNPLFPMKKGAVLWGLNFLSYGTLGSGLSTVPSALKGEQHIIYFVSGKGVIKAGKKTSELYDGIGVLIPPGIEFTISNSGKEALVMYITGESVPQGFRTNSEIKVSYEYDNPISTNVNRGGSEDWLFSSGDGLYRIAAFNPVMFEPMSYVPPHVHQAGVEEVWLSLDGDINILLNESQYVLPLGSAYITPIDGRTSHANVNKSDSSKKMIWIMAVPR